MKKRNWIESEINFLRKNYLILSDKNMGNILNRGERSISTRRCCLGLLHKNHFFPRRIFFENYNDEKVGEIIGHILGDGCITTKKKVICYTNTEQFLLEHFKNLIFSIFGHTPYRKQKIRGKNVHNLWFSSTIGRFLLSQFGDFRYKITDEINSKPLIFKIGMIRALFEDDGNVSKYSLRFINTKKWLVEWMKETLKIIGINSNISSRKNRWPNKPYCNIYILRISSKENLIKFNKIIGFTKGYRKQRELDYRLSSYIHGKIKKEIIKFLKNNEFSELNQIAKAVNKKRCTVSGHIHGNLRRPAKNKDKIHTIGLLKKGKIKRKLNPNFYPRGGRGEWLYYSSNKI